MKEQTTVKWPIAAIVTFVSLAIIGSSVITCALVRMATDIPDDAQLTGWYDVLCIEENGTADTYTIPVPEFLSFSPEFTEQYYQYAGEQFCDSIKDKTKYLRDVSE